MLKAKIKQFLSTLNQGYVVPLSLEEKLWRAENDPAWTTIDLPLEGFPDKVEEVLVEKQGENRYRIAASPGLIEGLAADDSITLDPQLPAGYTLLKRGSNVCVHIYCDAAERPAVQAALSQTLGHIGGTLDGYMGQTGLCFTVPVQAGFHRIEGALQRVVGDEWTYSNVFDLQTNEPLNWWLKAAKPSHSQGE